MKKELNIYAILLLLFFIFINNNAYARRASARDKACFSNIRVIQGAVEMYNMDVASMMRVLDIDKLIEGKYLKTQPSLPEVSCKYLNIDRLDGEGFVYCDYHGPVESPGLKLNPKMTIEDFRKAAEENNRIREENYKKMQRREKLEKFTIIIAVLAGIISLVIAIFPSKKNKTTA